MLISYHAHKKSSPRLPSWQPSLISFNIPIESGSIIKPCTLKHFQVPILAPGLLALQISAERCEGILHVTVVVCVHGYEYDTSMDGKHEPGHCAIWETHLKFISNPNLVKSRSSIKYISVLQLFWNYAHKMAVSLLCFAQNFKMIGYLPKTSCANETSRDLSF